MYTWFCTINKKVQEQNTSKETPDGSTAFKERSSKSLSGVEIIISGSELFRLFTKPQLIRNCSKEKLFMKG